MALKEKRGRRRCVGHQCKTLADEQQAQLAAMAATEIDPLEDRIVVTVLKEAAERVSKGGIVMPETVDRAGTTLARVEAVGPGRVLADGSHKPPAVQVGDIVLMSQYSGVQVELPNRGEPFALIRESDLLAVIR